MADISSDTTATGPMANSREVPMVEYINGGTTLVSEKVIKRLSYSKRSESSY